MLLWLHSATRWTKLDDNADDLADATTDDAETAHVDLLHSHQRFFCQFTHHCALVRVAVPVVPASLTDSD